MASEKPDKIMATADGRVHAAHALRGDLLDVLFPRGGVLPSEMLQVQVKLILQHLVLGIERRLIGDERRRAESWEALSMAALLREPGLIDFALARISEANLRERLEKSGAVALLTQLPTKLLGSDQSRLADLARALFHAEQGDCRHGEQLYERLPPMMFHLLCWRIVAALKPDGVDQDLAAAAKKLLEGRHSEHNPFAVAEKLMFFLGPDYRDELADPQSAGLSLFVAGLERDTGLDCDRIVQLVADPSPAPLLLLLKATGLAPDKIAPLIAALRADVPHNVADDYAAINAIEARAMIARWRDDEQS